jgi:hypothetical protein
MVNWASLRTGSVSFELFDAETFWDSSVLHRANRDATQLFFIVDSVPQERARLQAVGLVCHPMVSEDWYSSFRDPEGNWLQIFEVHNRSS